MLSLWQKFDDTIEFENKTYTYNSSFDVVCAVCEVLEDNELLNATKLEISLILLFGEDSDLLHYDIDKRNEALVLALVSLGVYRKPEVKLDRLGNPMPTVKSESEEIAYSLKYDADNIYSAFRQAYNINLIAERGKLHWKEFSALLNALPAETQFRKIVDIRLWKKPPKNYTEEKQMRKLKKVYALPKGGD